MADAQARRSASTRRGRTEDRLGALADAGQLAEQLTEAEFAALLAYLLEQRPPEPRAPARVGERWRSARTTPFKTSFGTVRDRRLSRTTNPRSRSTSREGGPNCSRRSKFDLPDTLKGHGRLVDGQYDLYLGLHKLRERRRQNDLRVKSARNCCGRR